MPDTIPSTANTNSASASVQKPKALDALTGLRFIAALTVVVIHAIKYGGHDTSQLGPYAANAVAFFFVLSGFILTYVYDQRMASVGTSKFYFARFARIWPLHIVCLLGAVFVDAWFGNGALLSRKVQFWNHAALLQSWLPIYKWSAAFNGPAWSISTEFAFYLAFPILLALGRKRFYPIMIASLLCTATILCALDYCIVNKISTWHLPVELVYVHPLVRITEFILGMWLGKRFLSSKRSDSIPLPDAPPRIGSLIKDSLFEILALGIVVTIFYFVNYGPLPDFLAKNQCIATKSWLARSGGTMFGFAAVVWVFSSSNGFLGKLFSTPTSVYLGEISFSLYLVQAPVLAMMAHQLGDAKLPKFYFVTIGVAMSLGFSMLLYAVVEMPIRQLMVSIPEKNWKKFWSSFSMAFRSLVNGYTGLIGACIVLVSAGLIQYERNNVVSEGPSPEILEAMSGLMDSDFAPITFRDEATLHWFKVVDREDAVELTMWWEILPGHQRVRFMHFCDDAETILFDGYTNKDDFDDKAPGSFVLDRCVVKKEDFKPGTKYLGIGFWRKGLGVVPADRGRRQMENRRLLVAEITPDGVIAVDQNVKAK
jgi:peptidoglycan/LPS O-acetylase OafA/YrhL